MANADKSFGLAPTTVTFSSSGSLDADDSIASYSWDFGDGTPSTDRPTRPTPTPTAGVFTATLTVTDQEGLTGTATQVVTALEAVQYVSTLGQRRQPRHQGAAQADHRGCAGRGRGQRPDRGPGRRRLLRLVHRGRRHRRASAATTRASSSAGPTAPRPRTVTGAANTPGVTANGATVATTLKRLTIQGGNGSTAAGSTGVLAQTNSLLTLDTVTVDSGDAVGCRLQRLRRPCPSPARR